MKRLSSLGTIFLLLISTFLILTAQDAQSSPISIISFQTDPSPVLVGQNFTYSIKVKNLDNKPIYVIPISRESFDPPDSVNIVKDYRPLIFVLPEKLDPSEVTTVGPLAEFSARRANEVRITVYISWSYSEEYSVENSWYEISETFSFMIYESQQETYIIYFSTEPPDVGSITFSGTTYTNGQSGEYTAGTYQIEANIPKGYIFYNWITTGGVSVANSESQQTIASVTGSGSLIAVFKWFVKLRGTVISHVQYPGGWPAVDVKVEELLLDTSNRLRVGEVVEVYRETPFTEINDGDRVEVYGLGFWIGNPLGGPYVDHGIVIKSPEHYIKKISQFQAVKFRGVIWNEPPDRFNIIVRIEDVLLDPEGKLSRGDLAFVEIKDEPSECQVDWPLHKGDFVEVYAKYFQYTEGPQAILIFIFSKDDPYDGYIKTIEAQDVKFIGTVIWVSPDHVDWRIKIEEILLDPTGELKVGEEAFVAAHNETFPNTGKPWVIGEPNVGDHVEVYGEYLSEPTPHVWAHKSYHYIKKIWTVNVGIVLVKTGGNLKDYPTIKKEWDDILKGVVEFYMRESDNHLRINYKYYPASNNDKGEDQQMDFIYCQLNNKYYDAQGRILYNKIYDMAKENLIPCVKDFVNFQEYDYKEPYGKGIMVFIIVDREGIDPERGEGIKGTFVNDNNDDGAKDFVDDNTNFDLITIFWSGIEMSTIIHELGHWLGDYFQGVKWNIASLPDLRYWKCPVFKGWYYDVMGDEAALALGSFNRVWLGWNSFRDYELGSIIRIKIPRLYKIGEEIPSIVLSRDIFGRVTERLIFDLYTRVLDYLVYTKIIETTCKYIWSDVRLNYYARQFLPKDEQIIDKRWGLKITFLDKKYDEKMNILEVEIKVEKWEPRVKGDVNNDGKVDLIDLAILASSYGRNRSDPDFKQEADLNADGIIDYRDLAILAANYGGSSS